MENIAEGLLPLVVDIDSVREDPQNARKHSSRNLAAIKRSLRTYGQRKPIVVNSETGIIEAGNGLWRAVKSLGWTRVAAALTERMLRNSSRQGDIILETFGGSGSVLIGCEKMDRRCYAVELDPHYCDVIINRWQKYTGKKAKASVQAIENQFFRLMSNLELLPNSPTLMNAGRRLGQERTSRVCRQGRGAPPAGYRPQG